MRHAILTATILALASPLAAKPGETFPPLAQTETAPHMKIALAQTEDPALKAAPVRMVAGLHMTTVPVRTAQDLPMAAAGPAASIIAHALMAEDVVPAAPEGLLVPAQWAAEALPQEGGPWVARQGQGHHAPAAGQMLKKQTPPRTKEKPNGAAASKPVPLKKINAI